MKRTWILWLLLGLAYFAFSFALHSRAEMSGAWEIFGYDDATFRRQLCDLRWIVSTGVRHPGLGVVLSPVVLMAAAARGFGARAADVFLFAVFAGIGVLNAFLIRRLGGVRALVLWLCVGLGWIWAAVPESFPLAMTTLLAALCLADSERRAAAEDARSAGLWLALAGVASLVTVTNGPKILLAAFVCSCAVRRHARPILLLCGALFLLGAAFFAGRLLLWNAGHPDAPKTVLDGFAGTLSWIPHGLSCAQRLRLIGVNLLALPLQPQFLWTDPGTVPRLTVAGGVVAVLVWTAAALRLRVPGDPVSRAGLVFLGCDFAIHAVCGWGLAEGWLFSAHYLPVLVILLGRHIGPPDVV